MTPSGQTAASSSVPSLFGSNLGSTVTSSTAGGTSLFSTMPDSAAKPLGTGASLFSTKPTDNAAKPVGTESSLFNTKPPAPVSTLFGAKPAETSVTNTVTKQSKVDPMTPSGQTAASSSVPSLFGS